MNLLRMLNTMGREQVLKVQEACKMLLARDVVQEEEETPRQSVDTDLVLEAIVQIMEDRGCERVGFDNLRGRPYYSKFRGRAHALVQFCRGQIGEQRMELRMLLHLGVRLLAEHQRRQRIPTTHTTLMQSIDHIPGLLDLAFPGYAQHGLLKLVIRQEVRNVWEKRDRGAEVLQFRARR